MPIASINPATGERLLEFAPLSDQELDDRLTRAVDAFRRWRSSSVRERAAVVRRAGGILDAEKSRFAKLMTLEMGKLIGAAEEEAAKCALGCRFYADNAERLLAAERVPAEGERSYVAYEPLGVVLAVMPWNFPFWQVFRFAAPALAAGNVALLKHASNVPQCALAIEEIFTRAGAPGGVFQTLLVGAEAVSRILADARVAAATLTGSEGAGSSVASTAGRHIKKTVLELGGSDPFVVMPSADVPLAAETAVRARVINSGQSCIAAKRFIVHRAIADGFRQRFVSAMAALPVGDPTSPDTRVGPLASEQLVRELDDQVQRTIRAGARVLTGGRRLAGPGCYYAPTVLTDIPRDSPAYHDELFGPVASLFEVDDIDEAIRLANDTRFGLGASAWTRDPAEADRFATHIDAGSVFINGMVVSDPRFPFGGVKASGYGRELGAHGLREFTNVKTVRIRMDGDPGAVEAE
ncbi:MAG: NAD-dependent succinate-semialdehyde dehydrogenase [Gemmatimonadaceae bacterium]